MTEISNRDAKEVFWYFSGARAQAFSEKWRVQCRLIFRIYASVTEWQLGREGELQVGRAFSGDTAACFWHYPLDKGVVVEAPETDALTPPGGNSVNSVRGTFAVVHLGEPRGWVTLVGRRGWKEGKRGRRGMEDGSGRVSGPTNRRRKRIAAGVEQGNGWLITKLLTYHGLYVLHNRRHHRCHDHHRGKPHRYPAVCRRSGSKNSY